MARSLHGVDIELAMSQMATIFGLNTYICTGVRKVADNLKWSHGVVDARVQVKGFFVVCSCHVTVGLHGFECKVY